MPSSLMMADTNFPRFTGSESTEQKISTIQNYLFQLTEQLRWAYANIGKENFNETEFSLISEEIAGPMVKKYESLDLTVTDGGENSNSATIQITGDGLKTEAKTIVFKGMVTFSALGSEKGNTDDYTLINGACIKTGEITAMTLKGNTITGNTIDANTITSGTITGTMISGSTITGGTITGAVYNCNLTEETRGTTGEIKMNYIDSNGTKKFAGGFRVEYDNSVSENSETESRYRLRLFSNASAITDKDFSLKIESGYRMSLEAQDLIYMHVASGGQITLSAPRINLDGPTYINGTKYEPPTVTA